MLREQEDQFANVMFACADVLLVDTKKDLGLYQDGEGAKSVTPCCVGSASCGPDTTESARKKLDYDLGEYICKSLHLPYIRSEIH